MLSTIMCLGSAMNIVVMIAWGTTRIHKRHMGDKTIADRQTDDTREPHMALHGHHGWEMHGGTDGEGQNKGTHGDHTSVKYGECIFIRESGRCKFCVSSADACSVFLKLFVLLLRRLL